nr:hypothetical protein [Cytophagales bacterium]
MKKFLSLPFFFLVFLISIAPPKVFAQITVIDFENPPTLTTAVTSISIGGFTFAADFSLPKNIGVSSGTGFGGSRGLIDTNFDIGGLKKWTITRDGGSEFQFRSIYIQRRNAGSVSGTIQGFKNNIAVGSAKALNFDSSTSGPRDFSADPDFFDVDEIRIQGDDLYVVLDNFTYGSVFVDGATIPAEVTSINRIGAPLSNVPSVNFAVNFSKAASNVSPDDFILTRTGSANGNIATVSGSGTSFTVTVNTITGEGSLRLDLRSGTNITNANGNTGTPTFTVGQSHFVSSCLIESFEDETVGSKSFSTGVNTFTVTGNLAVYTEVPFLGIGGSKNVLKNSGVGTYTISVDNDKVVFLKTIAFYLSSAADGNAPTGSGTLTLRG